MMRKSRVNPRRRALADLDLIIRGKLLRERDLKSDDPRKKAIDTALRNDPDPVPVWLGASG